MSAFGDGLNAGAATFTPGGPEQQVPPMSDDSMLDEIEAELMNAQQQQPPLVQKTSYPDLPPHADEFWFPECRDCSCCKGFKHGCNCCAKERLRQCKCQPGGGGQPPVPGGPPPQAAPPPQQQQQPPPPFHHHPPPHHHHHQQPPPPPQHQQPSGGWMPSAPGPGRGQHHHNNPHHHHHQQHHHHHQGHPRPPHYEGGRRGGGGRGRGGRGGGGGRYGGRGGGGNAPQCRFFFTPSGCRFGDQCRFSHTG